MHVWLVDACIQPVVQPCVCVLICLPCSSAMPRDPAHTNSPHPTHPPIYTQDFWIAPSILSADFAKLGAEVDNVLAAGAVRTSSSHLSPPPSNQTFTVAHSNRLVLLYPTHPPTHSLQDIVHFDVMDNHYVPNLTIGPMVCKALRDHGVTAPIDVHLMVSPVVRTSSHPPTHPPTHPSTFP